MDVFRGFCGPTCEILHKIMWKLCVLLHRPVKYFTGLPRSCVDVGENLCSSSQDVGTL